MRKILALFLALALTGCAAAPTRDRAVTASAWPDDTAEAVYFLTDGSYGGEICRFDKAALTVEALGIDAGSVYVYDEVLYYGTMDRIYSLDGTFEIEGGGDFLFTIDDKFVQSIGCIIGGLYERDSGTRLDWDMDRFPVCGTDGERIFDVRIDNFSEGKNWHAEYIAEYKGQEIPLVTFTRGQLYPVNPGFHLYDGVVYHKIHDDHTVRDVMAVDMKTGAKTVLTEADEIVAVAHGKLYYWRGGEFIIRALDTGEEVRYAAAALAGRPFVDSYEDRVYLIDVAAQTVALLFEKEA